MPPLDFPNSPTTGQIFAGGNGTWTWDSAKWVAGSGTGFLAIISDTPPTAPVPGTLWWNSSPGVGQLYVSYNDGTSQQWVVANNMSGGGFFLPLTGGTLTGALTINRNVATPASPLTPTSLYVIGPDGSGTRIGQDAYGVGAVPAIIQRFARGTAAAPTAVQNSDTLMFLQGQGYAASAWGTSFPNITMAASENWTATANGSAMYFATTPAGGAAGVNSLILRGNLATFAANYSQGPGVVINANANAALPPVPSPLGGHTLLWLIGDDAAHYPRLMFDAFGTGSTPIIEGRNARGTLAAPSALQTNDLLFGCRMTGYGATGYGANNRASMYWAATENWTDTAQGCAMSFNTTPIGSNTAVTSLTLQGYGATFSGNILLPNNGWINGALTTGVSHQILGIYTNNYVYVGVDDMSQGLYLKGSAIIVGPQIVMLNGTVATGGGPKWQSDGTTMWWQTGSGNGSYIWYNVSGTILMQLNNGGALSLAGPITLPNNVSFYIRHTNSNAYPVTGVDGGNILYINGSAAFDVKFYSSVNIWTFPGSGGNFVVNTGVGYQPGGGSWANLTSDIRAKEDVTDFDIGLEAITALRPVRFRYNGEGLSTRDGRDYVGLVADEVESVMPEMVGTLSAARLVPPESKIADFKTLNTNALIYALVNAVKELTARLEAVEAH